MRAIWMKPWVLVTRRGWFDHAEEVALGKTLRMRTPMMMVLMMVMKRRTTVTRKILAILMRITMRVNKKSRTQMAMVISMRMKSKWVQILLTRATHRFLHQPVIKIKTV